MFLIFDWFSHIIVTVIMDFRYYFWNVHICVCFMQRKNGGSVSGPRTVLKANTECADDTRAMTASVNSVVCEELTVDNPCDISAYSDHLYCRVETGDEETVLADQPDELMLVNTESLQSSACCLGTEPEPADGLSESDTSACSHGSFVETYSSQSTLSQCPSVSTMQSLDLTSSTLGVSGTSNGPSELDVVDTEDVSLAGSSSSGICDSTIGGSVSLDTTCSVAGSKSMQSTDATDNCEVVELTGGRSVELQCQCGAHYSDPHDKLHVVECQRCHSYQHAACVNYDLTDPLRGNYFCPHCHVVEVCCFHSYVCNPDAH